MLKTYNSKFETSSLSNKFHYPQALKYRRKDSDHAFPSKAPLHRHVCKSKQTSYIALNFMIILFPVVNT